MWDINLPIFLQWRFGAQPPKLITTNISGYTVIHNSLFYECSYLETNSLHSFHYLPEELKQGITCQLGARKLHIWELEISE